MQIWSGYRVRLRLVVCQDEVATFRKPLEKLICVNFHRGPLFPRGFHHLTPKMIGKKAHAREWFWPVPPPVRGQSPVGCPGVKDFCTVLGSQATSFFLSWYATEKIVDRGDQTKFYVQNIYMSFWPHMPFAPPFCLAVGHLAGACV